MTAPPELGPFVLLEPQTQDFLGAVGAHAERNVDGLLCARPPSRIMTRSASKKISG
jgi:hypothetical protein